MFLHPSCSKKPGDELKTLTLDYIGPGTRYRDVSSLFAGIEKIKLVESDLERSVFGSSQLAFVCNPLSSRAVVTMMLLEQGKDVMVLPPLAGSYEEFDALQRTCNQLDRRLALLNPLHYLPAVIKLRELIPAATPGRISHAEIRMNPKYSYPLIPGIQGELGEGIFHVQLINEFTSSWPLSVTSKDTDGGIAAAGDTATELEFEYNDMILTYRPDPDLQAWELSITTENVSYLLDHTGMLQTGNQEVLVPAEKNGIINGMQKSARDFIDSVRIWKEPESNPVEGMMQLSINMAVSAAVRTGSRIEMTETDETV